MQEVGGRAAVEATGEAPNPARRRGHWAEFQRLTVIENWTLQMKPQISKGTGAESVRAH